MRIRDRLDQKVPAMSFEFFPPKDEMGFWDLYRTIESLRPLRPDYVTVTYGAGGSTRRKTIELVSRIKSDIGLETMAHMTCVGATRDEIQTVLDELNRRGIENVLALRGDPPEGTDKFEAVEGGFRYASELVAFIKDRYRFCIGAACYPESHPESPSLRSDLDHLKRKVDAGTDFLISQLFFGNEDFYVFCERAQRIGIRVPIIAGIMPILSVRQIKRFTQMCGAKIPPDLRRRIEAVEDDPEAVRHIGMFHATRQCLDLIAHGVAGIHFYTLNRSTATRAIFQYLRTEQGGTAAP
ncbi:MAG: methylenetetrahydrofolate reductase [NAD(P)H] [Phycisphaerales bacterium]|nr:MAG: methylenetetrahydrofolate reductase [NAD(P)H] [Phycisphaerales bacterium]